MLLSTSSLLVSPNVSSLFRSQVAKYPRLERLVNKGDEVMNRRASRRAVREWMDEEACWLAQVKRERWETYKAPGLM
jgi:hypothetical protein